MSNCQELDATWHLKKEKKKDEAARKLKNEKKRIKDQMNILIHIKAKFYSDVALQAQKIEEEIRKLKNKKKPLKA